MKKSLEGKYITTKCRVIIVILKCNLTIFRYPNAAIEVSREQALRAIRHVQRRFSPQVPNTLRAMGETIMSLRWQGRLLNVLDDINNVPYYQGNLEYLDNNAVVFGGLIFANVAFLQH